MSAIAPATSSNPAPAPGRSFREVWIVCIGHALTHWYPATFYLLLPLIGKELGLSYSQIGLVMTCQAVAGAISNIPGGIFVDTVGRKGLLMGLALFWIGLPYLMIGFTHDYMLLLLCVSLVGIGNNLWHPSAIPSLAARFPERKGLMLSLHSMAGNFGDALAPVVVGALLATFTWRQIVVSSLRPETSTSMRGLNWMRSRASRLLRSATSSSVPRSTNSNNHLGRRRLAMSRRSKIFCASLTSG